MANTVRSLRACEVCAEQYRPTYYKQRTCSRACGVALRRTVTFTIGLTSSPVNWRQCVHCSKPYTTRGRKRCGCAYQPTSGFRTLTCIGCSASFEYRVSTRHADYCTDCRAARVKERRRVQKHRRRAIERGAEAESIDPRRIYERDRWRCGLCRRKVNSELSYPHPMSASIDHVLPIGCGGGHTKANVQLAHLKCNHDKSDGGWQQLALVG